MGQPVKKRTLNDIITSYHDLEEMLIESYGDITPEIEAQMDWLEQELANKLDGYADFMSYLKGQIDWLKGVAETYRRRALTLENTIKHMKNRVLNALKVAQETKVKTATHSFSHVERTDYVLIHEDAIPRAVKNEFCANGLAKKITEYDKKAVTKWLKEKYYDKETKTWSKDLPKWAEQNFVEYPLIR